MLRLIGFLKPYKGMLFSMMLMYTISAACTLLMPYVMSDIVENGINKLDFDRIWMMSAVMLGLAIVALSITLINNRIACKMSSTLSVDMRRKVFEKVNNLDVQQFNKIGAGSLITRSTEDISWLEEISGQLPYVVVTVPVMFIGGVILSAFGDWVLALILLGVSPLVLLVVYAITKGMERRWKKGEQYTDIQNSIIRERISGIRVIRSYQKDSYEHQRAKKATRIMCDCFVHNNTVSGIVAPLGTFLLNVATVAIIYIGSVRLQYVEWVTAADIIAIIQYIALIGNAILIMSWTLAFLPRCRVVMQRIAELVDMPSSASNTTETQMDKQLCGDIKFSNVSYSYGDGEQALDNVNIDIKQGEIVAIIGGTGSGKTTLVKLIMNFFEDVKGERTLAGVDYNTLTQQQVRNQMSISLQKAMIFQGTVEENIKMGNKDATQQQVDAVVDVAQLSQFISSRKEGLQYKLAQSGSNLSGGQKQRINIARAILKQADIYIFDDSFSALDYLTEKKLRIKLNKYLKGKTQIIVTQRAATAMHCDKVYVMDEGRIVGEGTHKQLLDSCSVYREIYDSQLGGGNNVGN